VTVKEHSKTVGPRTLFRSFAIAEMFTWAGLITALILRAFDVADIVPIAGGIHGFVFLCYSATTVFVWVNQRWRLSIGLTGLLLAIVPFATVPFEIVADRRGLLDGDWRLAPGGEEPRSFIEQVQAWVLRHAILSIALLLLLVTVLFVTLLWLGPPVPRG
jgi:integral membrane protein